MGMCSRHLHNENTQVLIARYSFSEERARKGGKRINFQHAPLPLSPPARAGEQSGENHGHWGVSRGGDWGRLECKGIVLFACFDALLMGLQSLNVKKFYSVIAFLNLPEWCPWMLCKKVWAH